VPFGVSWWEILILMLLVLLLFGPNRLPEMGRSLGRGLREFKDSVTGKDDEPVDEVPAELPTAAAESRDRDRERERDAVS
jgi:sec-independent protein translocase protein TatA